MANLLIVAGREPMSALLRDKLTTLLLDAFGSLSEDDLLLVCCFVGAMLQNADNPHDNGFTTS